MGLVESGEVGGSVVVSVGSIAEDPEEGEVSEEFGRGVGGGGEGSELGALEELGEYEGVRGGGCADDEVCRCSRRGGRLGEREEGLGCRC